MPPRKAPTPRPAPTPRIRRRVIPTATPVTEEAPDAPVLMNPGQLQILVAQSIATALAAYETARNGSSGHSENLGGNLAGNVISAQDNPRNNPRSCSHKDFLASKPTYFRGTEGVVGLSRWMERMEAVFQISSCSAEHRVKYAVSTLLDTALSWWNDQATSMGLDAAYTMDWGIFKGLMIGEYCPRQEVQKLEQELWNHTMQGSEVAAYTSRFNDLASLCPGMVTPEYKKTERYIWGLASPVQGHVTASRPTTFDSAKRLAYQITEQYIRQGTMAPPTEKNQKESTKRGSNEKSEGDSKRYKTETEPMAVYAAITNTPTNISAPSKAYVGKSPYCNKCNYHHYGNCMFCNNCNGKGHTSNFCKRASAPTPAATTATPTEGGPGRAYFIGTKETPTLE